MDEVEKIHLDFLLTTLSYNLHVFYVKSTYNLMCDIMRYSRYEKKEKALDELEEIWHRSHIKGLAEYFADLLSSTGVVECVVRRFSRRGTDVPEESYVVFAFPRDMKKQDREVILDFSDVLENLIADFYDVVRPSWYVECLNKIFLGYGAYLQIKKSLPAEYITHIVYKMREKFDLIKCVWSEERDGVRVITGKDKPVVKNWKIEKVVLRNVYESKYAGHTMFEADFFVEGIKKKLSALAMKRVTRSMRCPGAPLEDLTKLFELMFNEELLMDMEMSNFADSYNIDGFRFYKNPQVLSLFDKRYRVDFDAYLDMIDRYELRADLLEDFMQFIKYFVMLPIRVEGFGRPDVIIQSFYYDEFPRKDVSKKTISMGLAKIFRLLGLGVYPAFIGGILACCGIVEPYLSLYRYRYAYVSGWDDEEEADDFIEYYLVTRSFDKMFPCFVGFPYLRFLSKALFDI